MALSTLPLDSGVQVAVDWLELKVLASEYAIVSLASMSRIWDTRRNTEDTDPAGEESEEDVFYQSVVNELNLRMTQLGRAYPFQFSASGASLELKPKPNEGMYAYVFCLLISHTKKGQVLSGQYIPKLTNVVRDYFQICATLAAAGEVKGHAYSFGFPRPDSTGFLTKLRAIYAAFGEATVVAEAPKGASRSPKDEQIDLISWKTRKDGGAGKRYVLGQVASGADWVNKTIRGGAIDRFHHTWFMPPGIASQASCAMFIPYSIVPNPNESVADKLLVLTHEFGAIYYRNMIPLLVQKGVEFANRCDASIVIERLAEFEDVRGWVDKQLLKFRKLAA
ncbi:hypothetical protein [Paraburkholderia xenovorans]|uniref:hypothetical protein n=1 Tax=Paraburkholderia xenovorans TaxID=36873 RepID=UPI0038B6B5DB